MDYPVTVLAPIKLAAGMTEADLLAASDRFDKEFANTEPGIVRRELVRTADGEYIDIVQFRSAADVGDIMEKEKNSPACHAYFAVMDTEAMDDSQIETYPSLVTYS